MAWMAGRREALQGTGIPPGRDRRWRPLETQVGNGPYRVGDGVTQIYPANGYSGAALVRRASICYSRPPILPEICLFHIRVLGVVAQYERSPVDMTRMDHVFAGVEEGLAIVPIC